MKKIFMPFIMALLLTAFAGCADNSDGTTGDSSNTPSYDTGNIPVDETTIELTKSSNSGGMERTESKAVTITNPRTEAGEYYPILISTAMGLNGEGGSEMTNYFGTTVKGVGYETYFRSNASNSKLVFGEKGRDMYDLNGETPLNANGKGTYYVEITQWNGAMPSEGKLVIAFLTKEEANKYIPNNNNIVLSPDTGTMTYNPKFLDNTIVDELNKLGALRQYTFTVKN